MAVYDFGASSSTKTSGGTVYNFGPTANQAIANAANQAKLTALATSTWTPSQLPSVDDEDTNNVDEQGFLSRLAEDVAYRVSPFLNPVWEVMDTINNVTYGTVYDAAVRAPVILGTTVYENIKNLAESSDPEVDFEWESGTNPGIPDLLKNKTFVHDPDAERFYDKAGTYTAYGLNMNAASKAFVNALGKNVLRYTNKGAKLNPVTGKPFTGVEGGRVGIVRDVAQRKGMTEAKEALIMTGAGYLASETTGSESPLITIPAEIAAVVASARKPTTYLDIATGILRSADTGLEIQQKKVLDAFEKKFGEANMDTAASKARGLSTDPYEAQLALETVETAQKSGRDQVLSVSQQIDDPGLLVAERQLALEDPIFAGSLDDQMDQAQYSLTKELNELLNPTTGTYNWEALESFLPKLKDDLLSTVDDRVRIAQENLESMLKIYDGDVTKISAEFDRQFNKVLKDVYKQEDVLWSPINKAGFKIDVTNFKQTIADIVKKANRETNIPAKQFAEYLGAGLQRTDKGWKIIPLSLKGSKEMKGQPKVIWPAVPMGDTQSPQVMKSIRTNLNEMVRDPNIAVDKGSAVEAQAAAVDVLTNNLDSIPVMFRNQYETATAYSKKVHDTFTRGKVIPQVVKAVPEKRLEVATGGAAAKETDVNVIAREFGEVFDLSTTRSKEAQSRMLKSADAMFKAKFAQQVDVNDIASFDAFIAQHKTWFSRFPETGKMIKEARAKAKRLGKTVQNRELKAEAARLDIFTNMTGKNPDQVMDSILTSANPLKNARRLRMKLAKSPESLQVFQDALSRRLVGQSLASIEAQVAGKGTRELANAARLGKVMTDLDPLIKTFKGKNLEGLELLLKDFKQLEKSLSTKGVAAMEGYQPHWAAQAAAKLGGVKAVNILFGSSSIVLSGAASNLATKSLQRLGYAEADAILKEAYRNPELMKILLSRNITQTQLNKLDSGAYVTGKTLFKSLTGEMNEE